MSDLIYYFLLPLINSLMYIINFYITLKINNNKLYVFYSLILNTVVTIFLQYKNFGFIFSAVFSLIYFKYILNINVLSFIASFLNIMLSMLISDAICGFVIEQILKIPFDIARSNQLIVLSSNIAVLILTIIFCFLLTKFLERYNFSFNIIYNNKFVKKLFYTTIFIFITFFFIFRFIALTYMIDLPSTYIFGTILLLSCIGIVYYYVNQTINISIKKDFTDKENKQLKDYTNMLENMSSDLRKFKHDYVNILYTLGDYINDGNIEGLKKYYNDDLLPESKRIVKTDKHITLLKNIKITPLKALVSSKLLAAQSEGIEINAEVLEEINFLSVKTIDICRIIGIFLDNAAESAILCEKKFIHFAMIKTEGNVIIVIMNSCPENIPPVYQLYQKNFSTKGTNRGIGLTSVKELIGSTYKNVLLNTTATNGIFKQELVIKNCNSE